MDLFNFSQLYSFVPIILLGGVLWFERMSRHGGQRRTLFLFLSLLTLAITGIFQSLAWTFKGNMPFWSLQIVMTSVILYYLTFMLLEYAIHSKRIDESFLTEDFIKGLRPVWILGSVLALFTILMAVYEYLAIDSQIAKAIEANHLNPDKQINPFTYVFSRKATFFLETIFLDVKARNMGILAYVTNNMFLMALFGVISLVLIWISGRSVFNLQAGVIRMRSYPFYTLLAVIIAAIVIMYGDFAKVVDYLRTASPLEYLKIPVTFPPIYLFFLVNLAFAIRMTEEFFFWSQYNLRSDRARLEQRQHALNGLIRRVITSPEEEDKIIVKETVENAMAKMKSRMVVDEYNVTGIVLYRVAGNLIKVDDPSHLIGYCTPLNDTRSFKTLEKNQLNDQILKTTYDIRDIRDTPLESIKDFGAKLIKQIMSTKESLIVENLPENYLGLQRLIGLIPVFDGTAFMGFILIFKDSFFKLYPAEREILNELSENLGTIFALMNGKEIQRERNRLQGEMQTARNIQMSILPKKPTMPGYSIATFMETATEVGGDVYDLVPNPYGNYFGIGDVSGHGLPAGMMALISMAAMHGALETSKTMKVEIPMDGLYDIVNRVLCTINRDRIGSDKFMTQNYFVEKNGEITHVGTHLVAVQYKAKTDEAVRLTGLTDRTAFLGLSEHVVSTGSVGSFKMEKGDILVLYSDGVSEAKNGIGDLYGLDGITKVLLENKTASPDEIAAKLYEDAKKYSQAGDMKKHNGHFADDFSLFILRKDD